VSPRLEHCFVSAGERCHRRHPDLRLKNKILRLWPKEKTNVDLKYITAKPFRELVESAGRQVAPKRLVAQPDEAYSRLPKHQN
jgi:hypothetical protein